MIHVAVFKYSLTKFRETEISKMLCVPMISSSTLNNM